MPLFRAFLALSLIALAASPSGAAPTHYMHEGRPVELELDPSRLLVLLDEGSPLVGLAADVPFASAAGATSKQSALDRWRFVEFDVPAKSEAEVAKRLETVAASPSVLFVSPVFQGPRFGFLAVTPDVLVRVRPGLARSVESMALAVSGEIAGGAEAFGGMDGAFRFRPLTKSGFDVLAIANRLAEDARVLWAEPDLLITGRSDLIPNDPGFGDLWGIRNTGQFGGTPDMDMDGDAAWDITTGSPSIKVLILDTGVQQNHPDINQLPGHDFTGQGTAGGPGNQCDNHGTTVAGCVTAVVNNAIGTVGIAPSCKVVSARIGVATIPCDGTWTGQVSWTVDALDWAEGQGVRVTNNSNSYGGPSSALDDKYASTRAGGMVHFASAGNDGVEGLGYPSSLPTVLSIAALTPTGAKASFSNYGAGLAFSAPGTDVYTTDRTGTQGYASGDYAFVQGTSFSSPYAAGVAALLLALDPSLPSDAAEDILKYTCVDLGSSGFDHIFGWGFVNAEAALQYSGWSDVTTGPLGDTGSGGGLAWGDYDGDGDPDLYIVNDGSANRLLRNHGDLGFLDETAGPLGDTGAGASAAWGDYDHDGDLDLYLVKDGPNKLLRNEGAGSFTDVTTGPLADAGTGRSSAWVDVENDGDLDLYIANDGTNKLLRNGGAGLFTDATTGPLGDAGDGHGAAWGDYDNDGDADLYLVNDGSANKLLRNDGAGAFTDVTSGPLGSVATGRGAAWGDYDADGDLDLYVTNLGPNKLLRNDGAGVFADATSGPLGDAGGGTGVGWADSDNDGDLDLYIVNDGSANKLLRNDGGGAFADATPAALADTGNGTAMAWADYDGDGLSDIYLANNGANKLFRNLSAPANGWLRVRAVGVVSNTSSIGARVRVVAGGLAQIREIDGGSGYLSQGSLDAEFGLGSAAIIDTLHIRWPSGLEKTLVGLPIDTAIVVGELEPPIVTVTSPDGGEEWGQGSVHAIRWTNTGGAATSVRIEYSANGGADWDSVYATSGPGTGLYDWLVPSTPTTQALVRIRMENGDGLDIDTSDAVFSILALPIATILSPNGGEVWEIGDAHAITWTNTGEAATAHTIEFSADSGATWTTLADSLPGDGGGSFAWTVPDHPTLAAFARVTLYNAEGSAGDRSDAVFFLSPPVDPATAFTDVTAPPLAVAGEMRGAAWGDYDGDSDLDLYLARSDGANLLLQNTGGSFVDATSGVLGDVAESYGAAWADYDNDGDLDLYLSNSGASNRLFRNDAGTFVNAAAGPIDLNALGRSVLWGDIDNDGDVDLYVVNGTGSNKMFRNNGDGSFADVTTPLLASGGTKWGAGFADYEGDGDLDLYLARNGENKLFRNIGGVFEDGTSGPLGDAGLGFGLAWGDYDNDGDFDLYLTNRGANRLLRNDGAGAFVDATTGPLGDVGSGYGAAWGDYDADGDLDLYIANDGYNRLLRNDGGGTFVDAANEALLDPGFGQCATWADYDADGDVDLLLTNAGGGNGVRLFRNDLANGAHWFQVRLEGTITNRSAIGARVRIVAGGLRQVREIASGSGLLGQGPLPAAFGIGVATSVDTVEVRWTTGITQVLTSFAADQAITIVEPGPEWADVTTGPLGDEGMGQGVAWGDYDGDGDEDLYIANMGGANVLLRNDGGGSFADATSGPLGDTGDGTGVAWADADNDGDLDLYLVNAGSGNKYFRNDGGGSFADATSGPLGDTGYGFAGAWGDYDSDGRVDLFVVNAGSSNRLLKNEGAGAFTDATPPVLANSSAIGLAAAWGDYDGDGDLDLYLCNGFEPDKLFRNDGAGAFTNVTAAPLGDDGVTYGADWGDYDNDGDLDLAIANDGSPTKLYRNEGGGVFTDATAGPIGATSSCFGIAWVDSDNDGDLDLFAAQYEENLLFENQGDGSFTEATDVVLRDAPSGAGAAFADYDGDGDLDLYLVNAGGANKLFRNDSGGGNNWVHVRLEGGASNRSAIGARVRVVAGGVARIREISGGSGFASQSSLAAEFGLGGALVIDSIQVRWPSGTTTDTTAVAANQTIMLVEPGGETGTSGPPVPAAHALYANAPNPFNPTTLVRFALPEPGRVRLSVHDVSGRLVTVLQDGVEAAGVFEATWDGRDRSGHEVGSGVYFVRMEAGRFAASRKMLLVR